MSKSTPKAKRPTKREKREAQRAARGNAVEIIPGAYPELDMQSFQPAKKALVCKTDKQKKLLNCLNTKTLIMVEGPAGCGKTYVPVRWAIQKLLNRDIERIVITRPHVLADDDEDDEMGALPGTLDEKFDPFFRPIKDTLLEDISETHLNNLMKLGKIEIAPLAYIRGRTFKKCFVMLDESQNATPKHVKTLLTRLGENATLVLNGDLSQKDINGASGLYDALKRFNDLSVAATVLFDDSDCVRSEFVKEVLRRYK